MTMLKKSKETHHMSTTELEQEDIQKPKTDDIVERLVDAIGASLGVDTGICPSVLFDDARHQAHLILNSWIDDHVAQLLDDALGEDLEELFGEIDED